MWRYFGITKRGAPSEAGANPVEGKLDLILSELTKRSQPASSGKVRVYDIAETLEPIDFQRVLTEIMSKREVHAFRYSVRPAGDGDGQIVTVALSGLEMTERLRAELKRDLAAQGFANFDVVWGD